MKNIVHLLVPFMALALANAAFAGSDIAGAQKSLNGSQVKFSLGPNYFNATLTVAGPNGFYARSESGSGTVSIDLKSAGATGEGVYTYELTAASMETKTDPAPMNNGRGNGTDNPVSQIGVSTSGTFFAQNGLIIDRSNLTERSQ
ncbi:MAG: hypothetical protein ABI451_06525 [Dokdonella sp.]